MKKTRIISFVLVFLMLLQMMMLNGFAATKSAAQSGNVSIRVEGYDSTIQSKKEISLASITSPASISTTPTAIGAIKEALKGKKLDVDEKYGYIKKVEELEEFDSRFEHSTSDMYGSTNRSGWQYVVNNQSPSIGVSLYELSDGDDVVLYYTEDYSNCSYAYYTEESVEIVEGEYAELTLKTLYTDTNTWITSAVPLQDAYILINGKLTDNKTDVNGKVKIKFDKSGNYLINAEKLKDIGLKSGQEVDIIDGNPSCEIKVNEIEKGSVFVTVENNTYDAGSWSGKLLNMYEVSINDKDSIMDAVSKALKANNIEGEGLDSGYISSINGLGQFDGGFMSGWMGTVNDWFTNVGFSSIYVEDGDIINIMYTLDFGQDIGGSWGNSDTTLKGLTFNNGELSSEFSSDKTEYALTVDADTTEVIVTPTATNKNYQVRTYLDNYDPTSSGYKRTESIPVADGSKIIIGVGDSSWPGMNSSTKATIYTVTVDIKEVAIEYDVKISTTPASTITVYDSKGNVVPAVSSGVYKLINGEYTYTASATGYITAESSFTVNEEAKTISVTLETAPFVFNVVDDEGNEITEASITVTNKTSGYYGWTKVNPVEGSKNSYKLTNNKEYIYRVSAEGYRTFASNFTPKASTNRDITITLNKQPDYNGSNPQPYMVNNMLLNVSDSNYLTMNIDETYELYQLRGWQIVNNVVSNLLVEPDYHYSVIAGDSVTISNDGIITATKNGVSIISVTYDAIDAFNGTKTYGGTYSAIDPDSTGIVVVNVGSNNESIDSGIKLRDVDTLYYLEGEEGYKYTFTPITTSGETLKVEVMNPVVGEHAITGFKNGDVIKNQDGSYTVNLTDGRNIIKISDSNDEEYHVVNAKDITYTLNITNDADSNQVVSAGDTISIHFNGISLPIPKIAGIYNPHFDGGKVKYKTSEGEDVSGKSGQFTFSSANILELIIPQGVESFTLTDGYVYEKWFGSGLGSHHGIKRSTTVIPNLNADILETTGSSMPDIVLIEKKNTPSEQLDKNLAYLVESVNNPTFGTGGGEWTILSLARSGYSVPENYYDIYYKNVVQEVNKLKEKYNGKLHSAKSTEHSRLIIGLTSIGKDITDVGGYNISEALADFDYVKKQGINGPIFALIALDSHNYEIPVVEGVKTQTTRQMLIDYILEKEINKGTENAGGWALGGNNPDPDITAMAIQALTPYYNQEKVKAAVDRGINCLSNIQKENGGFASWGTANVESIAQVVIALTGLEINPHTDLRFIKNDSSAIDALMTFAIKEGGFSHTAGGSVDGMATDQGTYALVAYDRFVKGKNSLYNMNDVLIEKPETPNADLAGYNAALLSVKESDYTEESFAIYKKVISENIVTEKNTQAEVDAATANIIAAQKTLVKKPTDVVVPPEKPDGGGGSTTKHYITLSIDKTTIDKDHVLKATKVEYTPGETVWDVLKRELSQRNIDYDYTFTVKYNSVYVESIDGDGEFDHGQGSGWMYCVNDWYPNYGASRYELEDNDVVQWRYTTNYGKDLGADTSQWEDIENQNPTGGNTQGNTGNPTVVENTEVINIEEIYSDYEHISSWAVEDIKAATKNGFVNGYEGKFNPKSNISRAEFIKIIVSMLGLDTKVDNSINFDDVNENGWFYPFINAAHKANIVEGSGSNFNPNDNITREQMAVILIRALELETKSTTEIKDLETVSDWAKTQVETAVVLGLMTGYDDNFDPKSNATREMAAVVAMRGYYYKIQQNLE